MAMTVPQVLAWLERRGTKRNRDGMARYAIVAPKVYGVSVADLRSLGTQIATDHALAQALWKTGWYEARMLTAFVADPARVTPAQMDRWTRDFDNWAICDHLCFHLYDRTPHAWKKIEQWSDHKAEFVKRAAFALLASVALHDKSTQDAPFKKSLKLIERAAYDERNFVKKGVSWALRSVGERSYELYDATLALARRLAESDDTPARWVGRDALRQMNTPAVKKRVAARAGRKTKH